MSPYRTFLIGFAVLAIGAVIVLAGAATGAVGADASLAATLGLMGVAAAVAVAAGYWLVRRDGGE